MTKVIIQILKYSKLDTASREMIGNYYLQWLWLHVHMMTMIKSITISVRLAPSQSNWMTVYKPIHIPAQSFLWDEPLLSYENISPFKVRFDIICAWLAPIAYIYILPTGSIDPSLCIYSHKSEKVLFFILWFALYYFSSISSIPIFVLYWCFIYLTG